MLTRIQKWKSWTEELDLLGRDLQDGARIIADLLRLTETIYRFLNRRNQPDSDDIA